MSKWMLLSCLLLTGCAFADPQISKALSEEAQLKESQKQTALLERQTKALEAISQTLALKCAGR